MKVITVCDTPPYGHAPTYQINTIKKPIKIKGKQHNSDTK
jgi:hypothetical protein